MASKFKPIVQLQLVAAFLTAALLSSVAAQAHAFVFEGESDFESGQQHQPRACSLLPETGPCRAYIPSFYYNATTKTCDEFIYGGCRGNANRFSSKAACWGFCRSD